MESDNTSVSNTTGLVMRPDRELCLDCDDFIEMKISTAMFLYVPPILMVVGTAGNFLTLVVLQSQAYRSSPTTAALSALALADIGVLNTGLLRHWLRAVWSVEIRHLSDASCKIHNVLTPAFLSLSACILALTMVERVISVWFPMRVSEWISKKRMTLACIILSLAVTSFYIPKLILTKSSLTARIKCSMNDDYLHVLYTWINFSLQFFIPLGIIFGGNILILVKLSMAARRRSKQMNVTEEGNKSATVMLVLIGLCFILTITPANIYFLGSSYHVWNMETTHNRIKVLLAYTITNLLAYVNSTINFMLYCLSGTKFRMALKALFMKAGNRHLQGSSDQGTKQSRISKQDA